MLGICNPVFRHMRSFMNLSHTHALVRHQGWYVVKMSNIYGAIACQDRLVTCSCSGKLALRHRCDCLLSCALVLHSRIAMRAPLRAASGFERLGCAPTHQPLGFPQSFSACAMPPVPIGEAAGLEPAAFKELIKSFLDNNHPQLAAAAIIQIQLGERASLVCSLEWSDFYCDSSTGKMLVNVPDVNKKTRVRIVPLNDEFAQWINAIKAGDSRMQRNLADSSCVTNVRRDPPTPVNIQARCSRPMPAKQIKTHERCFCPAVSPPFEIRSPPKSFRQHKFANWSMSGMKQQRSFEWR